MAVESSQIPEKTVEQIFDERYPLDKWKDSNYSILDKFSMRGRKGFVTGAAGGLGRNAAAALAQAGADVALVDLPVLVSAVAHEEVVIRECLQTRSLTHGQTTALRRIGVDEVMPVLADVRRDRG